jgi:uroporphyrinogen decarboxylase
MANHVNTLSGTKLIDCYTDGKALAEAQIAGLEFYGQDAVIVQSDNYYMAEAFGAKVLHYEEATPTLEDPVVHEIGDIGKLKIPDPETGGRMPVYLEAVERLKEQLGDEVAIRACGTGPFVLSGHLMGTERFLTELGGAHYGINDSKSALLDLLEITCETLIRFVKLQLRLGVTIVQCADSSASLDMISPEMYENYALPYERKFFETVNPLCEEYGAVSLLHICGDNTAVFPQYTKTGADIIEVDHKSDLADAKKIMGRDACIIGNLDPVSVLLQGSESEVAREAERCIGKAAAEGGYILGSGCEVARDTPKENVRAVVRAARQYRYGGDGS